MNENNDHLKAQCSWYILDEESDKNIPRYPIQMECPEKGRLYLTMENDLMHALYNMHDGKFSELDGAREKIKHVIKIPKIVYPRLMLPRQTNEIKFQGVL